MNNKTGELIEKYRKEKGLTQSELAKQLGVSNTAISKWENGNNLPDITLLEPLSEILGIDKLLLFTSKSEAKEETLDRIKSIKKANIIKNAISILVFIVLLLLSHCISNKIYKHRLDTAKTSQTEIYKFYDRDEELFVSGYIIFKENESKVIFEELGYQERQKTPSNGNITSAELYMYADEKVVLKNFTRTKKGEATEANDLLLKLSKSHNIDINITKKNLKNLRVAITINKNEIAQQKNITLEVSKEI